MSDENYYTMKGYEQLHPDELSPAMEDYLEMAYRFQLKEGYVRIHRLAEQLHVTPPSASKMMGKLRDRNYLHFEPYGIIRLTEKGLKEGAWLTHRHLILHDFFCWLNHTDNELALVEQIEHFVDKRTILNMEHLLTSMGQKV